MKEPLSPCQGCEKRYVGCHEKCDLYLMYKKKHQEWSAIVYKEKTKEAAADCFQKEQYLKYNEAKKKGYI